MFQPMMRPIDCGVCYACILCVFTNPIIGLVSFDALTDRINPPIPV